MSHRLAADVVLVAHLAFILFAIFGACLAASYRWVPWIQLPCAAWGAYIEIAGRVCPLTYLENDFRMRAGQAGYAGSFIEHHLLADHLPGRSHPGDLSSRSPSRSYLVNIAIYAWLAQRRHIGTRDTG